MVKKNILVLGGSSDIGISLITDLLLKNHNVYAHYSANPFKLKKIKKKFKNLNIIKCDFRSYDLVKQKKLFSIFKKIHFHGVVNLVGYIDNLSLEKSNIKTLNRSLNINALIPIIIEREIVKNMKKNRYGRILNCSSIGVKFGGGLNSYSYTIAKHCLEFIPNVYKVWAKNNILINNLRIGVTNTKIHSRMKKTLKLKERIKLIPISRIAKPSEISSYINFLILENTYITGKTLTISGGE